MTKSRAFNRFHRWTAKLRRRHLKAWLPEPREGEPITAMPGCDLRQRARANDELHALDQEVPQRLIR